MKVSRVMDVEGGWEGIYINGVLKLEGHTISVHKLLSLFCPGYEDIEVSAEWMEGQGTLPPKLSDVPTAKEK